MHVSDAKTEVGATEQQICTSSGHVGMVVPGTALVALGPVKGCGKLRAVWRSMS